MPPPKDPAPAGRKGLEVADIVAFFSRFRVAGLNLNDFPPPPEGRLERNALMALGLVVATGGVVSLAVGLVTLNGVFVAVAMAMTGLGAAGALYVRPDLGLASRALPAHPGSRDGEARSAWETALTAAAVVGAANAAVGVLLCALLYIWVHWAASFGAALALNAAAGYLGYVGDGINRRPLAAGTAGAAPPAD